MQGVPGRRWGKRFDKAGVDLNLRAILVGVVAQLVEHHNGIVGVAGSIPVGSTKLQGQGAICINRTQSL